MAATSLPATTTVTLRSADVYAVNSHFDDRSVQPVPAFEIIRIHLRPR